MSLSVYLYQFSKRRNSTKQPTRGTQANCVLKDNCNLTTPVITFNSGSQNYKANNYCYIPDFNRYYFITEWTTHGNNIWTASCRIDVLASYKNAISNYRGFVERASSGYNTLINDPYISPIQDITKRSTKNLSLTGYDTDGCFIIRTTGKKGLSTDEFVTGVNTYAMSPANFKILCENLFDVGSSDIAAVITEEAVKAFFNPFQYILSIMWFPFSNTTLGNNNIPITIPTFGWFEGSAPAYCVTDCYIAVNAGVLQRPSSLYDVDDFRSHSPKWTRYTCFLPGVGIIDLDPEDVSDDIYVTAVVDPITGEITYLFTCGGNTVRQFTGQIGVNVQITQLASNPMGTIANTVSSAASMFAGNPIAAAGSAVSAVQNALQPTMSINGNQGSMALLKHSPDITLYCEQYGSASAPLEQYGRACYKNTIISSSWTAADNLFLKLGAASISALATESELTELNNLVNAGFYYE